MSLDVSLHKVMPTEVYTDNITHNLTPMAKQAGLYEVLWRPEDLGLKYARELIPFLETGLLELSRHPELYLEACRANPDATVEVSR
jgi:hypothetical protein